MFRDLTYSGRIFDGTEALSLGIATRVSADPHAEALAYATDINDRMRDNAKQDLREIFELHDIELPADVAAHANDDPAAAMEPFEVYRDENVVVTAMQCMPAAIAAATPIGASSNARHSSAGT